MKNKCLVCVLLPSLRGDDVLHASSSSSTFVFTFSFQKILNFSSAFRVVKPSPDGFSHLFNITSLFDTERQHRAITPNILPSLFFWTSFVGFLFFRYTFYIHSSPLSFLLLFYFHEMVSSCSALFAIQRAIMYQTNHLPSHKKNAISCSSTQEEKGSSFFIHFEGRTFFLILVPYCPLLRPCLFREILHSSFHHFQMKRKIYSSSSHDSSETGQSTGIQASYFNIKSRKKKDQ